MGGRIGKRIAGGDERVGDARAFVAAVLELQEITVTPFEDVDEQPDDPRLSDLLRAYFELNLEQRADVPEWHARLSSVPHMPHLEAVLANEPTISDAIEAIWSRLDHAERSGVLIDLRAAAEEAGRRARTGRAPAKKGARARDELRQIQYYAEHVRQSAVSLLQDLPRLVRLLDEGSGQFTFLLDVVEGRMGSDGEDLSDGENPESPSALYELWALLVAAGPHSHDATRLVWRRDKSSEEVWNDRQLVEGFLRALAQACGEVNDIDLNPPRLDRGLPAQRKLVLRLDSLLRVRGVSGKASSRFVAALLFASGIHPRFDPSGMEVRISTWRKREKGG